MANKVDLVDQLYDLGLLEDNEQLLLSNGFEDAIVGVTANRPKKVIYDYYKAIDAIMRQEEGIDIEDAMEWLEEHMAMDVGEQTPIFIKRLA